MKISLTILLLTLGFALAAPASAPGADYYGYGDSTAAATAASSSTMPTTSTSVAAAAVTDAATGSSSTCDAAASKTTTTVTVTQCRSPTTSVSAAQETSAGYGDDDEEDCDEDEEEDSPTTEAATGATSTNVQADNITEMPASSTPESAETVYVTSTQTDTVTSTPTPTPASGGYGNDEEEEEDCDCQKVTVTVHAKRSTAAPVAASTTAAAVETASPVVSATKAAAEPSNAAADWRTTMVDATNKYRALTGAPSVSYDTQLETALKQAIQTKKGGVCPGGHIGGKLNGEDWGENYYAVSGKIDDNLLATQAVDAWYKTGAKCNYGKGLTGLSASWNDCGHYTQLMWKESTKIGCVLTSTTECPTAGLGNQALCAYMKAGNVVMAAGTPQYSLYVTNVN